MGRFQACPCKARGMAPKENETVLPVWSEIASLLDRHAELLQEALTAILDEVREGRRGFIA